MSHITVLRQEAVEALAPDTGDVIVDATLGSGGHTRAIADAVGTTGRVIALDVDPGAIADAQLWKDIYEGVLSLHKANFVNVHSCLAELEIDAVDGILADLGWRMEQFTDGGRGFSFKSEEPLHMTFGSPAEYLLTAEDIVNQWDEGDIANVLYGYGEERYARRIAAAIVSKREQSQIQTAAQLAEVIAGAVPAVYRRSRVHPATKSFQALRIAVNDELTVLESFITNAFSVLNGGGRLVIITFHSLEDRIVKHMFRDLVQADLAEAITKKPVLPTAEECVHNPRARSAKLRAIKKY